MANDFVSVIKPTAVKSSDDPVDVPSSGRAIPVLPVRDTVLFPHAVLPLTVGRESSIQLIQSLGEEKTILVVAQRDARQDSPQAADLYEIGTRATVHKVVKMPNQSLFVFTEGTERVRVGAFSQAEPFWRRSVRCCWMWRWRSLLRPRRYSGMWWHSFSKLCRRRRRCRMICRRLRSILM